MSFRLGLQVGQFSSHLWWNQALEVEVDESLFHRQNTGGLQSTKSKDIDVELELLHFNHLSEVDILDCFIEVVIILHDGKAQQNLAGRWCLRVRLEVIPHRPEDVVRLGISN